MSSTKKNNTMITENNDEGSKIWNLNDLYLGIDDKKIDSDINEIFKKIDNFCKNYQDKISQLNSTSLFKAIEEYEEILEKSAKISTYAYLLHSSDYSNQKYSIFFQNSNENLISKQSSLAFFQIEINLLSEEKVQELLKHQDLKKYQAFIRDTRIFKDHTLSNELEKLFIEKNITSRSAFVRLFDETINNLKFEYENKTLNSQEIFNLMSNKDEKIREKSALSIVKTFQNNLKFFAFITNILAKDKAVEDDYRKFKSPISSRNLSNFIEDEVVETMCETVKENYQHTSHRYYQLKAKILNKQYLNYWDRNAPINSEENCQTYSYKQAQDLVLEAYHDFNPKMAEIGKKFFDNNWIDFEVRSGKDSGAYSHPCVPSVHPYILMNFQGKTRDVMTLAHELGHGIHQYLARKQGFLQSSTPLTLAETASVFGEQLTFQKILKLEQNNHRKKIIIANKIEDMINTVTRQIAFLEFEKKIHAQRKLGEIELEKINQFWFETQQQSLGPIFKLHDDYKIFWCYIPHFIHSPFYVYSYAFGDCLVNSLYSLYNSQQITNFSDKYLNMLELGGVSHYKEMLEVFKIDISQKKFWKFGLDIIISYIDQLEQYL
ncbi:MAG: M3 family oligoendopeptidase [Alphaproteobacteria bacterium]